MLSLTTTSYAILGLLSLRTHTAYELAAQAHRSLRFTWPTAESRLYAEPKRLVVLGLVEIDEESAGPTRTRQRYRITGAGRTALAAWLDTKPTPPRAEFEFLLRVLFADAGRTTQAVAALVTTRDQAQALYDDGLELLRAYRSEGVAFPERLHLNMLWIVFERELLHLIIQWTELAETEIAAHESFLTMGESARAYELLDAVLAGKPLSALAVP